MIRVVTLEELDSKQVKKLCQLLYTAFGVGSEHSNDVRLPAEMAEPYDVYELLTKAPKITSYQDDRILFLTRRKLKDRVLPSGAAPTHGYAEYNQRRAVVSAHPKKDLEEGLRFVGRHALHQLGHLWALHHCLDPRCAMYPPWTPSFANGEALFCTFCRDKSEQKIRLAKS